jgi:hypothetical protein
MFADNNIRKAVDGARLPRTPSSRASNGHLCCVPNCAHLQAACFRTGRSGNFVIDIANGPSMDGNSDPTQHVYDLFSHRPVTKRRMTIGAKP